MNILNNMRLPKFDALATKTANCLLGFECETEDTNNSSVGVKQPSVTTVNNSGQSAVATQLGAPPAVNNSVDPTVGQSTGNNSGQSQKNNANEIVGALEAMVAKNKQQQMNSMSKGPYFLIFIIALLLMGFSLGDDEEE